MNEICEICKHIKFSLPLAIYVNQRHTERFIVGMLQTEDADGMLLRLVDSQGKVDGVGLIRNDSVYRVEQGSHDLQELNADSSASQPVAIGCSTWQFFLQNAVAGRRLLSVTMCSGRVIRGFPDSFDENGVTLQSNFANKCGIRFIHRKNIAWICCDSRDERTIEAKCKEGESE